MDRLEAGMAEDKVVASSVIQDILEDTRVVGMVVDTFEASSLVVES